MRTVAALYVSPRGPYPGIAGVVCWDEQRNAKLYSGAYPVVAHPPCGPWGRLSFLCTKQDPSCGPRAVEQVQKWGGVIEHPSGSQLWKRCNLPRPGKSDEHGFSLEVRQVSWGHCCAKPTMLYIVGVEHAVAVRGVLTGGNETHRVTNGSRGKVHLPRAKAADILHTPLAFAEWLVSLARVSRV